MSLLLKQHCGWFFLIKHIVFIQYCWDLLAHTRCFLGTKQDFFCLNGLKLNMICSNNTHTCIMERESREVIYEIWAATPSVISIGLYFITPPQPPPSRVSSFTLYCKLLTHIHSWVTWQRYTIFIGSQCLDAVSQYLLCIIYGEGVPLFDIQIYVIIHNCLYTSKYEYILTLKAK